MFFLLKFHGFTLTLRAVYLVSFSSYSMREGLTCHHPVLLSGAAARMWPGHADGSASCDSRVCGVRWGSRDPIVPSAVC